MPETKLQDVPGLICVTTYGMITQQTVQCLLEARSFNDKNGFAQLKYVMLPGTLVEKARNEAVRMMLRDNMQFLFFCDGDTTFAPDAFIGVLASMYAEKPDADAMGAWVPLRGDLALPTIDSGTGTWESHYPGSGIMPVMRTGGAFLAVKRHVFEAIQDPWFRMRVPARPIDFLAETDNYSRTRFDGLNPFRDLPGQPWERLVKCAQDDPSIVIENFVPVEVGEDSGFMDRLKMAGFRAYVNTNISCGHVDTRVLTWTDHKAAMEKNEVWQRQACGVIQ